MAENTAQALAEAATVLGAAKGKLVEAQKEAVSVAKRIVKREGEVALAQKAYDAAIAAATGQIKKA